MARWDSEAEDALKRAGFEIVDYAGVDDWQGWGVYLAKQGEEYAVLSWSYGSCSGCDSYENLSDESRAEAFDARC